MYERAEILIFTVICRYGFTNTFFGLASLNTLCGIAIARFLTVARPSSDFTFDTKKSFWLILIGWSWALIWAILPLSGWTRYTLEGARTSCSISWSSSDPKALSYVVCLFLFGFVVPTVCIIYCYIGIYLETKANLGPSLLSSAAQRKIYKRQTKVLRLIVGLTLTYFISWMPYAIVAIIATVGYDGLKTETVVVPSMFAKSSTVWNPVVYVLLNSRFRKTYVNMFRKLGFCEEREEKMQLNTLTTAQNAGVSTYTV